MVGFHTASLPSSCVTVTCNILLQVLKHYSISVLYLQLFLGFGATLGVVPITIRSYIADAFWSKHHFLGYIMYKRLIQVISWFTLRFNLLSMHLTCSCKYLSLNWWLYYSDIWWNLYLFLGRYRYIRQVPLCLNPVGSKKQLHSFWIHENSIHFYISIVI